MPVFPERPEGIGEGGLHQNSNGGPGIEPRLALVYDGAKKHGFSLNRWVEMTSTAAAKRFGMYPRKGTIAVGSDADIVVFDPERPVTWGIEREHMNTDYSLFEGLQTVGDIDTVFLRGKAIIRDGQFLGKAGDGQFLKRGPTAG